MSMSDKVIAGFKQEPIVNIYDPVPILQQARSSIVTNPFIPNEQRELELEVINNEANEIVEREYNQSRLSSIQTQTLGQIVKNIVASIIGFLNDLFSKPSGANLFEYIGNIFIKENRYAYIGLLIIILIGLYYLLKGNIN